jgi:hypothetical protein
LGDAGSLAVGFILGVLCLKAVEFTSESKLAILATPALIMTVPIIDTVIVTVTRLASGRAISNRGLDHCHHRLIKMGLSQTRVAFVLWALEAAGALSAVVLSISSRTITTLAPMFAIGLFLANLSGVFSKVCGRIFVLWALKGAPHKGFRLFAGRQTWHESAKGRPRPWVDACRAATRSSGRKKVGPRAESTI